MTALPAGWAEVPIGEVCDVVGGSTPKTKVTEYWDGDIPWLTPDDLARDRSQYVAEGRRKITDAGYASCSTQLVPPGTVLFTSRAPIGYVAIARHLLCTNQGFKSFVPPAGINSKYLYWYLRWATPTIRMMGSGTTFAEISGKVARAISLRLAPAAEQDRIVAAIEEQFSRLDEAGASLRAAVRRQELLRVTGISLALAGDWSTKQLRDVTAEQVYGSSAKAASDRQGGVPIVRMVNIRDGRVDLAAHVKYLAPDHPDVVKYALRHGDLLFNRTNSPDLVGKSAVFDGAMGEACFASYLIRVRLDESCLPEWAALYLNGPQGRRWAASVRTQQVGQANINGTKLASMALPIPPLEEQQARVTELSRQLSILAALTTALDRALTRSEHLRRSILERAFSGTLVPPDPNDEPASELLRRIENGRRELTKPGRGRRGRGSTVRS